MELPQIEKVPSIATVMTPFPFTVGVDASISEAEALMMEHDIRHIPVEDADHRLMGVVTERDIALLVDTSMPPEERAQIPVRRVFVDEPYVVDMSESLGVVTAHMASEHIGSALVVRDGRLAGIFTATDACRVLAAVLHEHHPAKGPESAA